MSNWQNALKAKNYTPENLGAAGQNGIKEYNELENDLAELKSFEGQEGYDPKTVAAIEKELQKLDLKITKAIEMREFQLANIQKMQNARKNGKEPKQVVKAETTQQAQSGEINDKPLIEDEDVKEKTNSNGLGWVLGVTATVVLGYFGVKYIQKNT